MKDHYEQTYRDSCVPASMCMIQLWRGQAPTEESFYDGGPMPLEVTRALGATIRDFGEDEERLLRFELAREKRIIAMVLGAPYVSIINQKYPDMRSRHGPMCAPGHSGRPEHAIVLVSASAAGYLLLDPYLPAHGQPLELSNGELARCFSGRAAIFAR